MKQGVKVILLLVLVSVQFAKLQGEEVYDTESDMEAPFVEEANDRNDDKRLDNKRGARLYHGFPVDIADYPYLAVVSCYTYGVFGVIISNTAVLTSAFPFNILPPSCSYTVHVGSTAGPISGGYDFNVTDFQIHDQYNRTTGADSVAIAIINGTFAGLPNVKPIAMRASEFEITEVNPINCFVVTWGFPNGRNEPPVLERADFQLITDQQCATELGPQPSSIQCAVSGSAAAISSDVGSPLVCQNRLYGITLVDGNVFDISFPHISIFAKLPAASIQNFIFRKVPRPNYLTCPCTTC